VGVVTCGSVEGGLSSVLGGDSVVSGGSVDSVVVLVDPVRPVVVVVERRMVVGRRGA
jgi:hypothetical protein